MAPEDDAVRARLALLDEYIGDLRQLQDTDFATYSGDKRTRRAVERTLQLAIEACLDIGERIVAREAWRRAADNQDVFAILTEERVIPADMLPRLRSMARFRNLIVHEYARVDDAAVYGVLSRRLTDFDDYARAIVAYLSL